MEEYEKLYEKFGKEADKLDRVKKMEEELTAIDRELQKLDPPPQSRGSVWLFLR